MAVWRCRKHLTAALGGSFGDTKAAVTKRQQSLQPAGTAACVGTVGHLL